MTSLLDQYEQNSQKTIGHISPPTPVRPEIKSASGFINMAIEDETPMFCKQKVNFAPPERITHMCVSSELIVLAMANGVIFRIDLKQPEKHEEIEFSKLNPALKLSGLFLDPLGEHMLLSFTPRNTDSGQQAELFYLNRKSTKIKSTSKFRGHEVTAVGWNHSNMRSDSTRPLLLGTSRGLILETELSSDSERIFQSSIEQYWKQLPITFLFMVQETLKEWCLTLARATTRPSLGWSFTEYPTLSATSLSPPHLVVFTSLWAMLTILKSGHYYNKYLISISPKQKVL